ncbi:Uncharacterized protein HZ326_29953 [Fusarium oxysporum f. sp. albedinis]|nr:Uncharacterized protein HZ326_29953 [Fusarium oxysporum f. sp. albedinis]
MSEFYSKSGSDTPYRLGLWDGLQVQYTESVPDLGRSSESWDGAPYEPACQLHSLKNRRKEMLDWRLGNVGYASRVDVQLK